MSDDDLMEKIDKFLAGDASAEEVEELWRRGYEDALAYFTSAESDLPCVSCKSSQETPEGRSGIDNAYALQECNVADG